MANYDDLVRFLYKPKDPSSLAVIRILFGFIMMVDLVQERGGSNIDTIWGDTKDCHFPLFDQIRPLSLPYICLLFAVMWIAALGICLGFMFRKSCILFATIYWYLILLDKSYWNNHTYLYGLISILLIGTSANNCWSIDYFLKKTPSGTNKIPYWNYFVIKFQLFILYFIAGLKKTDMEWLSGYSMTNLGKHWVFDPFKLLLSIEQVDYLIIHWSGFLIDISSGFLLIYEKTRPVAFLINGSFHIMNSRLFNIGMFPYVCLATLPIFCKDNWPKTLGNYLKSPIAKSNKKSTTISKDLPIKITKKKLSVTALIIFYCSLQFFLPYSHFITQGYNNWTHGLYGYSWDMMVHSWDTVLVVVKVVDHQTGEEHFLDPNAWTQNDRWSKHADMTLQYAECIRKNIVKDQTSKKDLNTFSTSPNISIYIDVWCSLNGRFQQRMFDPNYNLLEANWSVFQPVSWLKPLLTDYNDYRTRMTEIQKDVHSWSNYSDVMFIVDFPGLNFDHFISSDLNNVSLTVIDGSIYYENEFEPYNGLLLKTGQSINIVPNYFHSIKTISKTPACFMYTFSNSTKEDLHQINTETDDTNMRKYIGRNSPFPILENSAESYESFRKFLSLVSNAVMELLYNIPMPMPKEILNVY